MNAKMARAPVHVQGNRSVQDEGRIPCVSGQRLLRSWVGNSCRLLSAASEGQSAKGWLLPCQREAVKAEIWQKERLAQHHVTEVPFAKCTPPLPCTYTYNSWSISRPGISPQNHIANDVRGNTAIAAPSGVCENMALADFPSHKIQTEASEST